jgi:photosystem II stability/assembly factor-like uncharacterized protein
LQTDETDNPERVEMSLCRNSAVLYRLVFMLSLIFVFSLPGALLAQKHEPEEQDESGDEILAREDFLHQRRAGGPDRMIPAGAYAAAVAQHLKTTRDKDLIRSTTAATSWQSANPSGMFYAWTGSSHISGRTNSIAVNPVNTNIIYIGAAGGGIWKTTDAGSSWSPITDNLTSLACGAVTLDPSNPSTVYFGTGELNYSLDSYYGDGIYRSTDAGATWQKIATTSQGSRFSQIVVDPGNSSIIYAAGSLGVYKSTNGGSTWSSTGSGSNANCLVMSPVNSAILYATVGGTGANTVKKSTDGGSTWTSLTTGLPSTMYRTQLAIAPSNALVIYASITIASGSAIYRSTDGGTTWSLRTSAVNYLGSQGWYDNAIAVDPANSDKIVVGGLDIYYSTDGGLNLANKTLWYTTVATGFSHADIHFLGFQGSTLYCGSDGGVFRASASADNWVDLNSTLSTLQYQSADYDPNNPLRMYGGCQDNNLETTTDGGSLWIQRETGDGGYCRVDPVAPNVVYGAYVNGSLKRSSDFGVSFTEIRPSGSTGGLFYNPYEIAPGNHQIIVYGQSDVWITTSALAATQASGWTQIASTAFIGGSVSAIGIGSGDASTIYIGTNNGKIFSTTNSGAVWTSVTGFPYVTDFIVDPSNDAVCYASCGGFTAGSHIFKTTNNGTTWTSATGTLPNIPVNSIVLKMSPRTLFAGTDLGVYKSTDDGATWVAFNTGFPTVAVFDLKYKESNDLLLAATHGRGCFTFDLSTGAVPRILVEPPSVSLGNVNILGKTDSIRIANTSTLPLHITGVSSSNPDFAVSPGNATINVGQQMEFQVVYTPSSNGLASSTVQFTHDASGSPSAVTVTGTGISPAISVAPPVLDVKILPGDTVSRQLSLQNTGTYGNLEYQMQLEHVSPPGNTSPKIVPSVTRAVQPVPEVRKDGTIRIPDAGEKIAATDAAGGPDAFGYFWKDSREAGGPAFQWVDIRPTGTLIPLTGDDVNTGTFPVGFPFPFYGSIYTNFYVCTNGFISFTSTSSEYQNSGLPSGSAPAAIVAPYWDDLEVTSARIYYRYDGTKCIIQYQQVRKVGDPSTEFTFEIFLFPNGRIEFQYLTMTGDVTSSTGGIQNAAQTQGLTVYFNSAFIQNNLAVLIRRDWISTSPLSGSVPLAASGNVGVAFDATDLTRGTYTANLKVANNDPANGLVAVPSTLRVVGLASPDTVRFGTVAVSSTAFDTITAFNPRSVAVAVSSVTASGAGFSIAPSSAVIAPSDSAKFIVSFNPGSPGVSGGKVIFVHNAPELRDTVVLTGSAGLPSFVLSPASVVIDSVPVGFSRSDSVHISNTGVGPLLVSPVVSSNPVFSVLPSGDTIVPGGSGTFLIAYAPLAAGQDTALILFHSNAPEGVDTVVARGSGYASGMSVTVPLMARWNLISNPLTTPVDSVRALFPESLIQYAFAYDTSAHRYVPSYRLAPGSGYWVTMSGAGSQTINGTARLGVSVGVTSGWNLVGSVSVPVPASSVTSIPPSLITSHFFGYDGSYRTADTIQPGRGYWVKVNGAGTLGVGGPAASGVAKIRIMPGSEMPPEPPGLKTGLAGIPEEYVLHDAEPNPFNPSTVIRYELPADSRVNLRVYDLLGRLVCDCVDEVQSAGYRSTVWNASGMPSGVYFYRLDAIDLANPSRVFGGVKKMMIVK